MLPQLRPYQDDIVAAVREAWCTGSKSPCVVLPCGGGKSCIVADIARRTTLNHKNVLYIVHRRELVEQITDTFSHWGVDMNYCKVDMVQTVTRHIKSIAAPSLIITDENHHCLAASYRRIYDAFPESYRVGVTATPVRLNGDGLGDVNDRLIVGVTAKWLIDNHYLAPYDYYAPSTVDLIGVHVRNGEYVTADIEKAVMKRKLYGDIVSHYKKIASGRKAIIYCASIKHSIVVANTFTSAGIPAKHIDSETPPTDRKQIIDDFRAGKIMVLCNVDLISEGFDVPDCSCAILVRPTKSLTLYIQQSMRCMRYQPDKRAIIIDHVGNCYRFGMPDDERQWTLAKKDRSKKEQNQVPAPITCPECLRCFPKSAVRINKHGLRECPYCGYTLTKKEEGQSEQIETELKKIEGIRLNYTTADDCTSYNDLIAFAKSRGYKIGWAYYQAKMRGML